MQPEIAVHHDNNGFIVCEVAHNAGNRVPSCQPAGQLTPVSRHHLITAVRQLAHKPRHQNAVQLHALHHFHHGIVLPHLEGVVRKVADLVQRKVQHHIPLGCVPLLLRGEQAIERCQQAGCVAFRQCLPPPSPACRRLWRHARSAHAGKCSCPLC